MWMPIDSLPGIVYDFGFGSVGNASVYATGNFDNGTFVGVVGYNSSGSIVDTASGGIQGVTDQMNIVYLEGVTINEFLV